MPITPLQFTGLFPYRTTRTCECPEDLKSVGLKASFHRRNSCTIAPCGILTGAHPAGCKPGEGHPHPFTAYHLKKFDCGCLERRNVGESVALVWPHDAAADAPPIIVQLDGPTPTF